MGVPVKVSVMGVGADMKPTGKKDSIDLGPMDSEQFVQIVGQVFAVTPPNPPDGYFPPSFSVDGPSGYQAFHIRKGIVRHLQSERVVNPAEIAQIVEAPARATPPPPREASAVNTSGPQFALKVWKSDGRKTLFIISLFATGILFLVGVIVWPLLLLFLVCLVLAFILRSSGKGELKAGYDKANDTIWIQRPDQPLVFEGHASEILGFTVEADVKSGPYRPDRVRHQTKILGVVVEEHVHQKPHHPPPQVKVTYIVKAKRTDRESLDAIEGGACVNKGEAEELSKGLEGLLKKKQA